MAAGGGGESYAVIYAAARDLGYSEIEAMAYACEPDLFVVDHPDALANGGAPSS